jgi:hypothetical protein
MIEFATVTREIRSLIGRRRDLQTLLGSVFAGLGIFLQNALQGGLPESMGSIHRHLFAFYAAMLMVPSLILALRLARLSGGMVLNGILFAQLMRTQTFTSPGNVEAAARHNYFGVSFLQFLLMDAIAGFSTTLLMVALHVRPGVALGIAAAVMVAWMGLYFRFHRAATRFALAKVASDACGPFEKADWETHISACLEDANLGLNADVGFVGLIVFSVFEVLSGLGQMQADGIDLAPSLVREYGPVAFVGLMLVTCTMGLVGYVRVRLAVGKFSLLLDPTDRPFRPLHLTDSLLGYLLLAFLFTVAVHLMLSLTVPTLAADDAMLLVVDGAALVLVVVAEQLAIALGARHYQGLVKNSND